MYKTPKKLYLVVNMSQLNVSTMFGHIYV